MNTKKLAFGGILAALYAVVTVLTSSFAYGPIQFRVAEALCVLCFFTPSAVWALTLGCLLSNLFSPMPIDLVVGTLATLIGCFAASRIRSPWLLPLPIILSNALLVGLELAWFYSREAFWAGVLLNGLQVAAGETAVLYVLGLPLCLFLRRSRYGAQLQQL